MSQQWVQKTVIGGSNSTKNVKFSDKDQKQLILSMKEMRRQRNTKFYERQAIKERGKKATENKVVTPEVKRACFKLIIELGRKVRKQ